MDKRDRKFLILFFMVVFLESLAANFAHPVTPTIIKNLKLNDYMFGLAFAAMAFTSFLFSPFWGKISSYYSSRKLLFIGCMGYAVGQMLFCVAKTELAIVVARCFSGLFVGAIGVSMLIFLVDFSDKCQVAKNLAILATLQSVGAAFGYLIGGVVGVFSITVTFVLQVITLCLSGVLFLVFMEDNKNQEYEKIQAKRLLRETNPFSTFLESRIFMNKGIGILFVVVLFASLGTNAFDQCFNYYIKDQFGFTSVYNGALKAVIGFITLLANGTVCMWIIRKGNVKKSTGVVLLSCAVSIVVIVSVKLLLAFLGGSLIFFTFNAIYVPLLQDCVAKEAVVQTRNMVMGFYNSVKSLGMIGGALIAGFIYGYGAKLSFVFAGVCFGVAALFLMLSGRGGVGEESEQDKV